MVRLAPVGGRQHLARTVHAVSHRRRRASFVLDGERAQIVGRREPLRGEEARDLVGLAAQPQHQHPGEVGMAGVAAQGPAQEFDRLAMGGHAATGIVRQRHHAVDVGEVGQQRAHLLRDVAAGGGRAVHGGDDAEIVARGDAPVLAHDALEGGSIGRGHVVGLPRVGAEGVVALEAAHLHVVRVHMRARRDVGHGEADDLAVAAQRLALAHCSNAELVARRNEARRGDAELGQCRARQQVDSRDGDVVGWVQSDGQGRHGSSRETRWRICAASGRPL